MARIVVTGRRRDLVIFLDRLILHFTRHWLLLANAALGLFAALPLFAPYLASRGYTLPAKAIYAAYQVTCHQLPQRSFFIGGPKSTYSFEEISSATGVGDPFAFYHSPLGNASLGYQVAYCQRETAIFASIFLAGLLFSLVRRKLKPLSVSLFLALIAPMAVDGFTQLLGFRESNWQLRLFTGGLFGVALVWLLYPYMEQGMREVRELLEERFGRLDAR
ncbi:MAG: DUF2085 domain-containing protein [Chloroflexota bacterium]